MDKLILSVLLAAPALCAWPASAQTDPAGFTARQEPPRAYEGWRRLAALVPVRDGTQLAVTVYLPENPQAKVLPVLMWLHPGHRESIDPATGATRPVMAESDIAFWTGHGYAIAVAEMRGSGASFGARKIDRGPQIGRDGKDIIQWGAGQPW